MSSDSEIVRLWKVQASVNKLVLDGKRDPRKISDFLQKVIDESIPLADRFALVADLNLGIVTHPDGRKFSVSGYCHSRNGLTSTCQEHLAFINLKGGVLLGQLGLDLLKEQGNFEECSSCYHGYHALSYDSNDHNNLPSTKIQSNPVFQSMVIDGETEWVGGILLCFVEVK
ncbi:MAG: hypothetical protein AAB364_02690 [Patescibacteria group bacterium]